jgi:hypothetical protein
MRELRTSVLLFVFVLGVYSANGRLIGAIDTVANQLLPIAIVRGDGLVLNRFAETVRDQYYVKADGERLLSRYPVLPALLALPTTWLHVVALDRLVPGWTRDPNVYDGWIRAIAKNAAALVAALTALFLYRLLLHLRLGEVAVATTLATALGSDLWVVASQSPWQHGSAVVFLTLSLLLLVPAQAKRWRLVAGGLAVAASVCARPTSVLFAAPLALWTLSSLGRRALWFLVPAAAVGVLLLGHNWLVFDNPMGGLAEIEGLGHAKHGLTGWVTSEPLTSIAGTLLSPSRGLFVFSPWALLALAALPATRRELARFAVIRAALIGLLLFGLVIACYGVWWGGWTFGPRYWTEAMPLFGVLLGFALAWAGRRSRTALYAFRAAIAASIALQAIGAFYYPSSWNRIPVSVDAQHERLWDWGDTEIRRCLEEGPHRPAIWRLR